jgi:rhomboid family GlyGly-CTERM serine protease
VTSRAWIGLAALLGAAALAGWAAPHESIDWQPGLAAAELWRAWTAVAVHYSLLHVAANLAGAALVGALGVVAQVPRRITLAWVVAWPLTQLGLLVRPELLHYGGLSGVLHAGVAAVSVHLLVTGPRSRRVIGAVILAGLATKVVLESPWGPPLTYPPGWDIAVAPFAHASGAIAGLLCALLASLVPLLTRPPDRDPVSP